MTPTQQAPVSFFRTRRKLIAAALVLAFVCGAILTIFLYRNATSVPAGSSAARRTARSKPFNEETAQMETIHFLIARVKHDPDDFVAQSMLASHLLQQVRATGNADALLGALKAAKLSLQSVPASRNAGGLSALARAQMAAHDFIGARASAEELAQLDPATLGSWGVLADVLLEQGEYARADAAIQKMRALGEDTAETEIRVGRLLFLQGDTAGARKHFFRALAFANNDSPPVRETVAWCHWQLGETEFAAGRYPAAEAQYRAALESFPHYPQALASLGRVRAAQGDLTDAIEQYKHAIRRYPDPTFVAALGDLYEIAGHTAEADTQYELVEQIAHLSALNGVRFNRQLALFYADHSRQPLIAFDNAAHEYSFRKDIYGADALAWAALKAGKLTEAQTAIKSALRLSTEDAKLFYHAGMIARAAGDQSQARLYLQRALNINPGFDPLQANLARKTLHDL